ncbi:molybdate transport system substrate-binding protein [Sulfurivirga caldicuralii]|uniref:Molybdate transport system substrate-binding protein n=1 Tax=Sulfurivirga caldicuralii TaxID=364032 RepID=A0A1N6DTY9_9GAMM|nr:molybdate ABC transporter substrate-binding protein [Sulfurivirga caldicuralii]SIN74249.1 molybdate transport system substrate-binding protein [Sulfurivirga caldicuralii]
MVRILLLIAFALSTLAAIPARAEVLTVAVSSNFVAPMQQLVRLWQQRYPDQPVRISSASTGKLYAQILHGAPFDLFFAADAEGPRSLYAQGRAQKPATYALGELVLWQRAGVQSPLARLKAGDFRRLALANPKTAPYGRAAQQVLQKLGLWPRVQSKLVRGENVGQAFQFVRTGNAELGFAARSQLIQTHLDDDAHRWLVDADLYDPIVQQAVVIKGRPHEAAAQRFLDFVLHDSAARAAIAHAGYRLPL